MIIIIFLIIFDNKNKNYKILKAENKKNDGCIEKCLYTQKRLLKAKHI